MAWDIFRRRVLRVMVSSPKDPNQIARAIASGYDAAMRHPSSGDLVNRHTLVRGNKKALELWIALQFYQQALSLVPIPPSLPSKIAQGFTQYWLGATLRPGLPPAVVPPGMITNMTVLNPGTVPLIPLPPAKTPEEFVESLIRLGKMHLFTIGGNMIVNVITPTGPVPTPAPWFGYKVIDARANFNVADTLKKISAPSLPGLPNIAPPPSPPPSPTPTPTPPPPPSPPPVVTPAITSPPTITNVTSTCVFIGWQMNTPTIRFTWTYSSPTSMGGSGSGNGTSTASCGLNPNTQYYYTIYFYDQNGVFITQYSGAFTTTI